MKNFEFPLPPLDEQKRIAEILWAADEALEKFSYFIEKITSINDAYMRAIISDGSMKKWKAAKLTDCFEIVSGQVDPKKKPYSSMPLVAPNHIEQSSGRILFLETAKDQNSISGKYLFQPGDVVYSKIRPNLRKAFIADFEGLCSADMYPLRPFPNRIIQRFLLFILLSEQFTSFALTRCVRTGIPKLNRQEFSEFKIPLPNIEEQEKICSKLEAIDEYKSKSIEHRNIVAVLKNQINLNSFGAAHV